MNFEPSLPQERDVKDRYALYNWVLPDPAAPLSYPPCLDMIPPEVRGSQAPGRNQLFNNMRLLDTANIVGQILPEKITFFIHDYHQETTFRGIEDRELANRRSKADIYTEDNIGCRKDWYSDAVFAQQSFTGANPTTITQASATWI